MYKHIGHNFVVTGGNCKGCVPETKFSKQNSDGFSSAGIGALVVYL